MDTIYKTYKAEVKGVNADEGTVDVLIPVSTASVDRDGEIVEPGAFKKTLPKFMKRPVLVASHDYRALTSQIGEWTKLKITESGVEGKPKYYINEGNEQSDWGFKLASKGMAAFSIGFIPKVWADGDGVKEPRRTYKEVELLEISQVIVPSNREAIQSIRSKSVDPIITEICDEVEKGLEPEEKITLKFDRPLFTEKAMDELADAIKRGISKEVITKPEETDEYIRIPVDRGDHEGHRIRTIDISEKEGIKAIYCGTDKVVMTYLFAKDHDWTMAKARAWVKEHEKKTLEVEHKVSQAEIIDEIDYLKTLIEKEGLSEEGKKSFEELLRVSGYDNPVEDIVTLKLDDEIISKIIKQGTQEMTEPELTNQDILESLKRISNIGG